MELYRCVGNERQDSIKWLKQRTTKGGERNKKGIDTHTLTEKSKWEKNELNRRNDYRNKKSICFPFEWCIAYINPSTMHIYIRRKKSGPHWSLAHWMLPFYTQFSPFHPHTFSLAARKIFQLSKYSYRVILGRKCACLRIFATRAIIQ